MPKSMRKTRTKTVDRRLAHPYSKVLDLNTLGTLGRLDQRTHPGRLARDLSAELVEHIGGNPTVTQRLLIERTVKMSLQLDALDAKLERGEWTQHDQKIYNALTNAFRLTLREIEGMGPRRRNKKKGPDLDELITEHRRPA